MNIASEAKSFVYIKEKETGFPLNGKPMVREYRDLEH